MTREQRKHSNSKKRQDVFETLRSKKGGKHGKSYKQQRKKQKQEIFTED